MWSPTHPEIDPHTLAALVVDAHDGPATPPVADVHNRMLGNGSRLYVDHAHPELSGPECSSPREAAVHEVAADAIVRDAARRVAASEGIEVRLFRNTTDGKGASYGHHENFLLRRSTPFDRVLATLPAFLVSRVALFGAGRVGLGPAGERPGFQISQRADFFERVSGLDTTRRRGIVNTRDEPLASREWRRLHLIISDANRSPWAAWLRLGATSLALAALEADALATITLADPVAALRTVSRDLTLRHPLDLADGSAATALDLQRRFLNDCAAVPLPAWGSEVLDSWSDLLDDLAFDPFSTTDRLDWTAKLALLQTYQDRDGLDWDAARLAQLDLSWADVDETRSVHDLVRRRMPLRWTPTPAEVASATCTPPPGTRAHTRGRLITDHPDAVVGAAWESMLLRDGDGRLRTWPMPDPLRHTAADYEPPGFIVGGR